MIKSNQSHKSVFVPKNSIQNPIISDDITIGPCVLKWYEAYPSTSGGLLYYHFRGQESGTKLASNLGDLSYTVVMEDRQVCSGSRPLLLIWANMLHQDINHVKMIKSMRPKKSELKSSQSPER